MATLRPQGSWKDDFYEALPENLDGTVIRTVHVFVGHDDSLATEAVGFALTAEAYASGIRSAH